jgi:hypothetical protein
MKNDIPNLDILEEEDDPVVEVSFKKKFFDEVQKYYETICKKGYCHVVGYPKHRFISDHKATQNKAISEACAQCEVHEECLFYALGMKEYYIWGGSTDKFREMVVAETRKELSAQGDESFASSIWNQQSWTLAKKIAIKNLYLPTVSTKYNEAMNRSVVNHMSDSKVKKNT